MLRMLKVLGPVMGLEQQEVESHSEDPGSRKRGKKAGKRVTERWPRVEV